MFAGRFLSRDLEGASDFHECELGETTYPLVAQAEAAADFAERNRIIRTKTVFGADHLKLAIIKVVQGTDEFFAKFAVIDLRICVRRGFVGHARDSGVG